MAKDLENFIMALSELTDNDAWHDAAAVTAVQNMAGYEEDIMVQEYLDQGYSLENYVGNIMQEDFVREVIETSLHESDEENVAEKATEILDEYKQSSVSTTVEKRGNTLGVAMMFATMICALGVGDHHGTREEEKVSIRVKKRDGNYMFQAIIGGTMVAGVLTDSGVQVRKWGDDKTLSQLFGIAPVRWKKQEPHP